MEEMKEENEEQRSVMMKLLMMMMMIPKIIHQNLKLQDPMLTILRVSAPQSQNKVNRGGSAV
jgi:hypothetical protein